MAHVQPVNMVASILTLNARILCGYGQCVHEKYDGYKE